MFPAFKAGSDEKKKEVLDKVAKEAAPKTLKYLARLLEQRGGDYFAGNEVNLKCNLWPFCVCQCILFCIPVEDNLD